MWHSTKIVVGVSRFTFFFCVWAHSSPTGCLSHTTKSRYSYKSSCRTRFIQLAWFCLDLKISKVVLRLRVKSCVMMLWVTNCRPGLHNKINLLDAKVRAITSNYCLTLSFYHACLTFLKVNKFKKKMLTADDDLQRFIIFVENRILFIR